MMKVRNGSRRMFEKKEWEGHDVHKTQNEDW